ncbi:hypothetical protein EW146_g5006 [Bondarzewia mesenterica]|uniref:Translation initiation factor eIF2B subunit gamma n=1 Tax=Bondarzewia mesenterica TaxID=1095465 RepID=A0A4S4LUL6_9AGAM|nr:hypothetical protein EW146_g5006 [Bondarzewia mesenterica]
MDFQDSATTLVSREFIAVVLAGFGNELLPLTSDHGDEPCPKALIPIANKPMIDYPLTWLEQSGIIDVLLICPTAHRASISHHIHSDTSSSPYPSLQIDLQTYDESQDLSPGTCTVLRHFSNRIQKDFILLPCDFIPPESLPLNDILNKFRIEANMDGSIMTSCWFQASRPDKGAVPEEWGLPTSRTPIIWDDQSGTLLHIDTPDDLDQNADELMIRMSLLSRYPRTNLSSSYQDSHVYMCKRAVLDLLQQKTGFDSFREEFVPWLCKLQYQRAKREKYGRSTSIFFFSSLGQLTNTEPVFKPISNDLSQAMALRHSTLQTRAMRAKYPHMPGLVDQIDSPSQKPLSLSMPPSPTDSDDDEAMPTSLRVGLVIHSSSAGYCARANNLPALLELNRHFLGQTTYALPTDPENRSLIDAKSPISSDSMIGDSTRVGERTNIKRSVIGNHCVIGKMVKISGCVLLDHCVVEDGAKLDGCILGKDTKVGAKGELIRCLTQSGYEVDAGETYRNEKLEVSDWTAAPEDSDTAESENDGGSGTSSDG